MLLLALFTSAEAWARDVITYSGDTWNEATKTLTVNSNRSGGAYIDIDQEFNLVIGPGVTEIGNEVFYNCSGLKTVTMGSNVTVIGYRAFKQCPNLTSVNIPSSVKTICEEAFRDCTSLKSVTIDNGVETIGKDAFRNTGLTSINIPSSVTTINDGAFYECTALATISGCNSVTSCGKGVVDGTKWKDNHATGLMVLGSIVLGYKGDMPEKTSLTIPTTMKCISGYAFSYCDNLISVTIPDNVVSIGEDAFSWCANLATVNGCEGVTSIGDEAFAYTSWEINLPYGMNYVGHVAYCYRGDMPGNTTITLKDGTTEINEMCFKNQTNLVSITIPASVTKIDTSAFKGCTGLTSVNIPASVTSIGIDAFNGCTNMTDVYCEADPTKLTWKEWNCDDFKSDGTTKCHVENYKDWSSFVGVVHVKFVSAQLQLEDDSNDNWNTIVNFYNHTCIVTLNGRTLKAGHWNTLYLPFDLSATQIETIFGAGTVVRTLNSYSNDGTNVTITFANVKDITAGTPYIVFIPEGENIVNPVFSNVTIKNVSQNVCVTKGDAKFWGTYNKTNIGFFGNTALFLQNDMFYHPIGYPSTEVNAFRCYFVLDNPVPDTASANIIIDWGDEETTGIASMEDGRSQKEDVWYDLNGRKLDSKPTTKGIYIVNGKKVAIQ